MAEKKNNNNLAVGKEMRNEPEFVARERFTLVFPLNVGSVLNGQKNKAIKTILSALEREFPDESEKRKALRQIILDAINDYNRSVITLLNNLSNSK